MPDPNNRNDSGREAEYSPIGGLASRDDETPPQSARTGGAVVPNEGERGSTDFDRAAGAGRNGGESSRGPRSPRSDNGGLASWGRDDDISHRTPSADDDTAQTRVFADNRQHVATADRDTGDPVDIQR